LDIQIGTTLSAFFSRDDIEVGCPRLEKTHPPLLEADRACGAMVG
jgi:hypothetical protein